MSSLFRHRTAPDSKAVAERLHDHLVAATRRPVFYLRFGVPDTFEGRFDLLLLHIAVILHRLRAQGNAAAPVAQHLVDVLFRRFDIALREMGVSDIGVPKRMKTLAEAYNGRTTAYLEALATNDETALAAAIRRNIQNGEGQGYDLAAYAHRALELLASCDLTSARDALPDFPDPVEAASLP